MPTLTPLAPEASLPPNKTLESKLTVLTQPARRTRDAGEGELPTELHEAAALFAGASDPGRSACHCLVKEWGEVQKVVQRCRTTKNSFSTRQPLVGLCWRDFTHL